MSTEFSGMRRDYVVGKLSREDLDGDPVRQFERWFADAVAAGVGDVNAMVLSTVDASGAPSSRVVLLKGVEEAGFVFYTNMASRKGREIAVNPLVALAFYWSVLERQIRVEGRAEPVAPSVSDAYFATRPRESQIGAWASSQSDVLPSRESLEESYKRYAEKYEGVSVPRPPHWGGYIVRPSAVEFWHGRSTRLHDRFRYTKRGTQWTISRLAP